MLRMSCSLMIVIVTLCVVAKNASQATMKPIKDFYKKQSSELTNLQRSDSFTCCVKK